MRPDSCRFSAVLDTVLIVCIVLQILVLPLMILCILTLYAPLAMLAHWNILLIWISAPLAGRLLAKRQLSLCIHIRIQSVTVPLPLIVIVLFPVLAISLVSFHYNPLLIIATSFKYLLSSGHAHVFFSDVVISSLQNISRLGFLQ